MKISKLYKKIACAAAAAVFAAFTAFLSYADEADTRQEISSVSVSRESDSGVSMETGYGYRDTAKKGHKLPFGVHITNHEQRDISARLEIRAAGSVETGVDTFEAADNLYSFDIFLPAEGEADADSLISVSEENGAISVRLFEGDELLCEKNENVDILSDGSELLIGILSDTPEKLDYFNGVSVAQTELRSRTIELDPASLPENAIELDQLDMIIVSNLSMGRMTEERVEAIEKWYENGGVLLVGGGRNNQAAQSFGAFMENFEISAPYTENIDMGMQYSKNGPDGAILRLNVCDIGVPGGMQLMQSSDIAALTVVSGSAGAIGFAAYDFCDISDFCAQEISFTDNLLTLMLGHSRIEHLINSAGSSREVYDKTQDFMGVTSPESMPGIFIYIIIAAVYLIFTGGVLYFLLRNRGLELYYHAFVVIAAFAAAFAVWMIGSGSRYDGLSLDYTAVRELHDGNADEAGYIRVFSAASDSYSLQLPDNYEIYPIVHVTKDDLAESALYDGESDAGGISIEYHTGEHGKSVSASGLGPFAGTMLEFSAGSRAAGESDALSADIRLYDERFSGTVVNNTEYDLEDAALLAYGRVAEIGTVKAGESIDISDVRAVTAPTADSYAVAAYITGIGDMSGDRGDYINVLKRTRFLSYYMQESLGSYYGGVRLIGFSSKEDIFDDITADRHAKISGTLLKVVTADTSFRMGRRMWRTGLSSDPKVVSGDYDTASNTSRGAVVLEYSFGSDIDVEAMYFAELDESFATDELAAFSGQVSVYNYVTGSYDYTDISHIFTGENIKPYLSPSNTVMIRYIPDENAQNRRQMFLPVPNISGNER